MGRSTIPTPIGIFYQIILVIESIVAFLGNGFIIAVIGHRWLQNRKMAPCDFLLNSLSTSRFLLQLLVTVSNFLYRSSPETYIHTYRHETFGFLWMFFNLASLCCATWLSIFYCVKVTNFAHPLFLWLKLKINVLVPRLLGMSIIAIMLFSVPPFIRYFEYRKRCNLTGTLTGNTSHSKVCNNLFIAFLPMQYIFVFMNFSISLTASILVLLSLWRHVRNLKKSGSVLKDLSTQVHINVMTPLLFYLFFYIMNFAGLIIAVGDVFSYGTNERLVADIMLSALPSAHSVILILSNPKLKEVPLRFLKIRQTAT